MPSDPDSQWAGYAVELGRRLRARREDAGLTQEQLAHRAGLTRTHYQQIEAGSWKPGVPANPSIRVLAQIAQALEADLGDLLPPTGGLSLLQ